VKRLIVCCDGTWQKLENPYPTNVVKMAQAVKPIASDGVAQIVFYEEGIGTENPANKLFGGAFGKGIDRNIQNAYRFLCLNFAPGDEIYLFGYSRGAYTARSLAGMIYNSGLLSRPHIRKAPEAYRLYRDEVKPNDPQMVEFRRQYGDRPPITLLMCWDTVGSLGIPDLSPVLPLDQLVNNKYRFHDTKLSRIIENALHAVAVDEPRKVFDVTPMTKNQKAPSQKLHQIWFPGNHGCIGGGSESQRGLSDGVLQWTIETIRQLGLGLDLDPSTILTGIQPNPASDFSDAQRSIMGKLILLTGYKLRDVSDRFEDFHESVSQCWRDRADYRPKNLEKHRAQLDQFAKSNRE